MQTVSESRLDGVFGVEVEGIGVLWQHGAASVSFRTDQGWGVLGTGALAQDLEANGGEGRKRDCMVLQVRGVWGEGGQGTIKSMQRHCVEDGAVGDKEV